MSKQQSKEKKEVLDVEKQDDTKEQLEVQETKSTEVVEQSKVEETEVNETEVNDTEEKDNEVTEPLSVKASYDNKTKLAVASTDITDRHNEQISQEGWDLKNFKKNPVMLWGHDHHEIAVGNARNIHVQRTSGKARLVFTPDFHEETPTAKALKALYDQGRLNSFSVGFIPKDFDGKTNTYLKQELLEISAVNVPANHEAMMLAYKTLTKQGFKPSVIKKVTGVDNPQDLEKKENKLDKVTKKHFEEYLQERGAVSDQMNEIDEWEQKREKMEPVREIWWAFCDVYFHPDTPSDDFEKLCNETISLLSKAVGTEVEDKQEEKVLDNNTNNDNDKDKLNSPEVDTSAKEQEHSSAPEVARAKQSITKVIVKASDRLLSKDAKTNDDHVEYIKVIKRAADILSKHNK